MCESDKALRNTIIKGFLAGIFITAAVAAPPLLIPEPAMAAHRQEAPFVVKTTTGTTLAIADKYEFVTYVRQHNDGTRYDLSGQDISGIDLSVVNLSGWNLEDANCYNVTFIGSTFTGTRLSGADFSEVDLTSAHNLTPEQLMSVNGTPAYLPDGTRAAPDWQDKLRRFPHPYHP